MNLIDLYTRMSLIQLMIALVSIAAVVAIIILSLCKAFVWLFGPLKRTNSYKKERNRFKDEISEERELNDAVKSVILILAIAVVMFYFSAGK